MKDRFQRSSKAPALPTGQPTPEDAAAAEQARLAAWQELRRGLETLMAEHEPLRQLMGARVALLRFVQQLARLGPAARATALGPIPAEHAQLARALLARLEEDADLARRIALAVDRFDQITAMMHEIQQALAQTRAVHPALGLARLRAHQPPKVRGQLSLLLNYDLHFRDDPLLAMLFPPLPREGHAPSPPRPSTRPLGPTRPPLTAPLQRPAVTARPIEVPVAMPVRPAAVPPVQPAPVPPPPPGPAAAPAEAPPEAPYIVGNLVPVAPEIEPAPPRPRARAELLQPDFLDGLRAMMERVLDEVHGERA